MIDDDQQARVMQNQWLINKYGYVYRLSITGKEKRKYGRIILLHRFILEVSKRDGVADHIDGNPLNNCKSNLRKCTHAQNAYNHKKPKNNTSGFKGVNHVKEKKREYWRATITCKGKQYTKKFKYTPENLIEAAKWYNQKAKELFGDFAKLNIIDNNYQ